MEGEAALSFKGLVTSAMRGAGGTFLTRISTFTQRYPSFPGAVIACAEEDVEKIGFLMRSHTREEMFGPGNERFIRVMWRCAEKHGPEFESALRMFCAKRLFGCHAACVLHLPSNRSSTVALSEEGMGEGGVGRAIHFVETEDSPGSPFADERVMAMLREVRAVLTSPGNIPKQIDQIVRWPPVTDVSHAHAPHDRIYHRKGLGCVTILEDGSVRPLSDMPVGVVTGRMKCREE